jgi:hypothetical protein
MSESQALRNYAHVSDGLVINVSVWDGVQPYDSGEGVVMVPLPYTADADGNISYDGGIGWTYVDGIFVAPPLSPPTWDDIRAQRHSLLNASDWTQVADAPLNTSEKQDWADYRQALRDVPQDFDSPDDVVWPEAP